MRCLLLVLVSACGAEVMPIEPPGSVRERLAIEPANLTVDAAASAGTIAAEHKVSGGWSAGLVDLAIQRGDFTVALDEARGVTLETLVLEIGPIEIPESVLGYPVQLTDIRLQLAEPVRVDAFWSTDDEARGDTEVEIVLAWSLVNHGTKAPLGAPDLPPVPAELALAGTGTAITGELRASAPGELWSWAGLLRLQDLALVLTAHGH
jgi:hypothetical protein